MDRDRRRALALLGVGAATLAGCGGRREGVPSNTDDTARTADGAGAASRTGTTVPPSTGSDATAGEPAAAEATSADGTDTRSPATDTPERGPFGYTHVRADGNRVVAGRGSLPDAEPVEIAVASPAWLAAVPREEGSLWAVVDEEGRTSAFAVDEGGVEETTIAPARLPAGTPPLLAVTGDEPIVIPPPDGASTPTHPIVLDRGRSLFVAENGDVVLADAEGGEAERVAVGALPDARLIQGTDGRVVVLAGATDRYDHGALGDGIEAETIAVLDTRDGLAVEREIDLAGRAVIEGTTALLADLGNGDDPEIVVTESDAERGAREVTFTLDGRRVAAGPAIGSGYRWRHRLAVAPFGPGGREELAAVRTPHIGGEIEFYRRESEQLRIVATLAGYSSHAIGSRVLDGGVAGDLDGDGRTELLVPNRARTHLAGIRRTGSAAGTTGGSGSDGGAREVWRVPVGGTVATNVAATALADGGMAVGVGHANGVRIWQS